MYVHIFFEKNLCSFWVNYIIIFILRKQEYGSQICDPVSCTKQYMEAKKIKQNNIYSLQSVRTKMSSFKKEQ